MSQSRPSRTTAGEGGWELQSAYELIAASGAARLLSESVNQNVIHGLQICGRRRPLPGYAIESSEVDGALPGNVKDLLQNDWQAGELAWVPEADGAGVLEPASKAARLKVAIA